MSTVPDQSLTAMKEDGTLKGKEDRDSGGSVTENVEEKPENKQEVEEPPLKRCNRHSVDQISKMETLFRECPHPDEKKKLRLSRELGLTPHQVKFWFQNRRTQLKTQQDRIENLLLRSENEKLRLDNHRLEAAIGNGVCHRCVNPCVAAGDSNLEAQYLRLVERLREELDGVVCLTSRFTGRSMAMMTPPPLALGMNTYSRHLANPLPLPMVPPEPLKFQEEGIIVGEAKSLALELAFLSMHELVKMCRAKEPLWLPHNGREVLNRDLYRKMFSWPSSNDEQNSSQLRTEASRNSSLVSMDAITLVETLLDNDKWMALFPSIVSSAKTLQVVSSGASGNPSGSLQLMYAELQVLSPLVPIRETHFLRYCHQNTEDGKWIIVDFPIDSLIKNHVQPPYPVYRRLPSGCVIQDLQNGYSMVNWVEHAELEDKPVHPIFSDFVYSGMAFGAQRWLGVLCRQCEKVASLMARNISDLGVIPSLESRKNLMKLAQRMMSIFGANMSASSGQTWSALSDSIDNTTRITTRKMTEPGHPCGVFLTAASSIWLPYSHAQVFDLLMDEHRRPQLDVLPNANSLHEVVRIASGSHPGNRISLFRTNVTSNSSQQLELMLQESCTDQSESMIVYTAVDVESIQMVMNGGDPSSIALLPQGLIVIPTAPPPIRPATTATDHLRSCSKSMYVRSECVITVGLQVLANTIPCRNLDLSSVASIHNHLCNTLRQIGLSLSGSISNHPVDLGSDVGSFN